eukprot:gene3648-3994_t
MDQSNNPLLLFPTKKDVIRHNFAGLKHSKSLTLAVSSVNTTQQKQWLHLDHIDPTFGVSGTRCEDDFARSYRRLASSGLFTQSDRRLAPLDQLEPATSSLQPRKYVLVEESRLQDLLRFDDVLACERRRLGQQCGFLFVDGHMPACIPVPATRHAIHHMCEQQMAKARVEILRLQSAWHKHCQANHYLAPPIYMQHSFVDNAPVAQRALKLRLVREARQNWRQRYERDHMTFEDDLSYWSNVYGEAMLRQRDYERYYILATRYGPFSQDEFALDSRPGKRYYTKAVRGALKLQLLWDRYWAMARLRRFRACRMIQKHWRMHNAWQRFHPIIRLRLKFGKRTYFIFCMALWKRYVYLCKLIREAITFYRSNYVGMCFAAWKKFSSDNRNDRQQRAKRLIVQFQNAELFQTFQRWRKFIVRVKVIRRKLHRWFALPQFDMWVDFVKWQRHLKTLHGSARRCQTQIRILIAKKKLTQRKAAVHSIHHFMKILNSVLKVKRERLRVVRDGFKEWSPEEMRRRYSKLNDVEKGRLHRKQGYVFNQEKSAVLELQDFLSSGDGNIQLQQLLAASPHLIDALNLRSLSRGERRKKAYDHLSHTLKDELVDCVRCLEGHNYDAKFPPFLKCFDPRCQATFTNEEQYHNHLHQRFGSHPLEGWSAHAKATKIHLLLCHPKGQEVLRDHWTASYGLSGIVNVLDFYVSLQELKKVEAQSKGFYAKAHALFDLYCAVDAPRRVNFGDYEDCSKLVQCMKMLRENNITVFPGYYHDARARPGLVRKYLLGWEGPVYQHFSVDLLLRPDLFQGIELLAFHRLVEAIVVEETDLLNHPVYRDALRQEELDKEEALFKDYQRYRQHLISTWARGYMQYAARVAFKAAEVVSLVLEKECQKLYNSAERIAVRETVQRIRYAEQVIHEEEMLIIDEAVTWTEEASLEGIFDFYARSLVEAMWEVVDNRKGMLQYAGLMKSNPRKFAETSPIVTTASRKAEKEWFDNFLATTLKREKASLPVGKVDAAVRLQKRLRGMMARKKARIIFAKRFKKYLDESYGAYYYFDNQTGEACWSSPKLFHILFPKAVW